METAPSHQTEEPPVPTSAMNEPLPEPDPKSVRKVITAAGVGHFVEWFDFGLYGTLATVISMHFFAAEDPQTALLSSFAVFGVGFVIRPVGGLFWGSYGDRHGRQKTLVWVITLTSAATMVMGLLPTYDQVGVLAPALLVLARLVQGFAAGGETSGSTTLLAEYAPARKRGFVTSFIDVFGMAAFVVGAGLVLAFTAIFGTDALNSWGWRALFLLALPLGFIGLYLRNKLEDTPEYKAAKERGETSENPLRESLSSSGKALLFCVGFVVLKSVGHWILQTFMPSYLQNDMELGQQQSYLATVAGLIVIVVLVPFMGALSDRIGRRPVMIAGCVGFIVCTYPALMLMSTHSVLGAIGAMMLLGVFMAAFDGAVSAAMTELFPTRIRNGSMGIAYNIAVAIFGGATPYFATFLISSTGNRFAPAYYVMAAAAISLITVLRARETAGKPLPR